jgi:hypothetical protein
MANLAVADIYVGAPDATGEPILAVYSKVTGLYAVYRTKKQVMIQYADEPEMGANQRSALTPLEGARGEVTAMLDALRKAPGSYQQTKVEQFDRRVASALSVALRGNPAEGLAVLLSVKDDMSEDRASDVRTRHLIYAAVAALAVIFIARMLSADWFVDIFGRFEEGVSPDYWNAGAVGALGAFFSIALQIRSRQVSIDLQPWDNLSDAILRIFVGATSAVVLIGLLKSDMVNLMLAGTPITEKPHGMIIAAFAAGFVERLVSDFLAGFSLAARRAAAAAPPPPTGLGSPQANERTIAGAPAAPAANVHTVAGRTQTAAATGGQAPVPVQEDSEMLVEPEEEDSEAPDQDESSGTAPPQPQAGGPVG